MIRTLIKAALSGPEVLIETAWRNDFFSFLDGLDSKSSEEEIIAKIKMQYSSFLYILDEDEEEERQYSQIKGELGIIYLSGPIFPASNFLTRYVGIGTDLTQYRKELKSLRKNEAVKKILNIASSPGGNVSGVDETSALVEATAKEKDFITYTTFTNASACYWITSKSTKIMGDKMSMFGSIGTIATVPKIREDDRYMEISNTDSPHKVVNPETEDGKKEIVRVLDAISDIFFEAVAVGRKVTVDKIKSDFGKGGLLIASEALKVGMIDEIISYDDMMEDINKEISTEKGERAMELSELKAKHPDLVTQIEAGIKADLEKKIETLTAENQTLTQRAETAETAATAVGTRIEALEKENEIRRTAEREATIKATAKGIMDKELKATKLPTRLHSKIKVDHEKFINAETNVFNAEAYAEAVKAEIKDWEGIITETEDEPRIQGMGGRVDNPTSEDEIDAEAKALLKHVPGYKEEGAAA